jgi:Arc/MetJ-type ribon-helix-helix transcriptional regulator
MVRTQVLLSPEQAEALRLTAAAEGRSMADLVREAVDAWLRQRGQGRREGVARRSVAALGRYGSGERDLGSAHDRHLDEAFARPKASAAKRR